MMFSLGVATFMAWRALAFVLIVSSPFVWFYARRRWLCIHLALATCHAAVLFAVTSMTFIPPAGLHDIYILLASRYFSLPVACIDILVLCARAPKSDALSVFWEAVIIGGVTLAVFLAASWSIKIWIRTIAPTVVARARSAAGLRAFCLDVGLRGHAERLDRLTMENLNNAFKSGLEYYGYYALMKVGQVQ